MLENQRIVSYLINLDRTGNTNILQADIQEYQCRWSDVLTEDEMDAYKPGSIGQFEDFIEDSLDMETCLKSPNTHDQVPETCHRPASGLPAEYD